MVPLRDEPQGRDHVGTVVVRKGDGPAMGDRGMNGFDFSELGDRRVCAFEHCVSPAKARPVQLVGDVRIATTAPCPIGAGWPKW